MKPEEILKQYAEVYHSLKAIIEYLQIPDNHLKEKPVHQVIIEYIKQPQTSHQLIKEMHSKHMLENHSDTEMKNYPLTALVDHGV